MHNGGDMKIGVGNGTPCVQKRGGGMDWWCCPTLTQHDCYLIKDDCLRFCP